MFDSHCHLDAEEYARDRDEVLTRAREAGVTGILVPACEPSGFAQIRALCAAHPMLGCALGLHPWYVHKLAERERETLLSELCERATEAKAVAIGECGLDAPKAKAGGASHALQERVLTRHLEAARALGLPIVLHCVGAHARLIELLARHGPLPAGGVLHSYSGSKELIARYLAFNLSFSFAGIVTHPSARRPREALKAVPGARLLVESDGPDQAPRDVFPRRSEPAHVLHVLRAAAEIRDEPCEFLAQQTTENARRLFAGCQG